MGNFQINVKVGTPPIDQILLLSFGQNQDNALGHFIFDKSIIENSNEYYSYYLTQLTLYDMTKSSTADIVSPIIDSPGLYDNTGGYVSGNTVQDIFQIGNVKFNYKFIAAIQENGLPYSYLNGLVTLDRYQDNIFDIMYQQKIIQTRDYMLTSYTSQDKDKNSILNVNLEYDLDQDSKNYKYPSNQMIAGQTFNIKAYGIYLNDQDVTDKIKYRVITFDEPLENTYVKIPIDLYQLINQDPQVYDLLNDQYIFNCPNCQCEEIDLLPSIKVVSQEYVFEITPSMYTNYYLSHTKTERQCTIHLVGVDNTFNFSYQLSLKQKIPIMYQKASNSLKFVGLKTVSHLSMEVFILVISLFSGTALIILIYSMIYFYRKYKFANTEYYRGNRYIKFE
ncbi:hypothetical protein ABPG74_010240 [Tetrahymena malaccensis]